ncbi:uncharacterized protein LOC126899223 isoform X2 [Daktulosphaira vitifoliae]|uniref:uncharacterized protein LOC126899223 isoform X2 n=1 Tax=Daktulosphaira vitifoliae TaxID=58002 RepID=UPI0021AAABB3|nr:uncharacterized protein LOC126899223 isoform X2 [Daktulosphaira vitifoliae]
MNILVLIFLLVVGFAFIQAESNENEFQFPHLIETSMTETDLNEFKYPRPIESRSSGFFCNGCMNCWMICEENNRILLNCGHHVCKKCDQIYHGKYSNCTFCSSVKFHEK